MQNKAKKKINLWPLYHTAYKNSMSKYKLICQCKNLCKFQGKIKILVTLDSVNIKMTNYYTRHRKREKCLI